MDPSNFGQSISTSWQQQLFLKTGHTERYCLTYAPHKNYPTRFGGKRCYFKADLHHGDNRSKLVHFKKQQFLCIFKQP
jgi:hypothetical protein